MKNLVIRCICITSALLFAYAAISKLMDYHAFSEQLAELSYARFAPALLAILLPVIELATALLLLFSITRLAGLYFAFLLMLLFTIIIFSFLYGGAEMPCPCGGILSDMDWDIHLLFNVFFTLLALTGIILQHKQPPLATKTISVL